MARVLVLLFEFPLILFTHPALMQVLIPLGSSLCVIAMMMISLAQTDKAYQLFLSQGVLFGIGIALMYALSLPTM